jgi:hypothetical protein
MSWRDRLETIPSAEVGDLSQHYSTIGSAYPAPSKLCILFLLLCSNEEAPKLLRGDPTGPGSTERVEDQITLPTRGQNGAAEEAQRLLGWMISVELLPPCHGRDVPDGRELGSEISAIDQVVVEGMAGSASLARP